jgi:hypothetical protein
MAKKYILADELHIHSRNFPSLFKHIDSTKGSCQVLLVKSDPLYQLITAYGSYKQIFLEKNINIFGAFLLYYKIFSNLEQEDLFAYCLHQINIFEVAKLETLSLLITQDNWCEVDIKPDNRFIFDKAYVEDRETLILNMAAGAFWITTWMLRFEQIYSSHFCIIFSGSCTYARTLMAICRQTRVKCYVLESTFTGNDYLCEELYQSIPNNSKIQFSSYRQKILTEFFKNPTLIPEREIIKAKSKIVDLKNKNVNQPLVDSLPKFKHQSKIILLAAQVVNDFSILVGHSSSLSSIYVYKKLIREILEKTDCNLIIKTHPWEENKVNIKSSFSFKKLADFLESFPPKMAERVLLVEHENLYNLFSLSDYFVTLCSQSGLEAALEGFKPVIIGKAFYSNAGFTSDYPGVSEFIADLIEDKCQPTMNLNEYHHFENFALAFFQAHAVSIHQSGLQVLNNLFASGLTPISQSRRSANELTLKPKWIEAL